MPEEQNSVPAQGDPAVTETATDKDLIQALSELKENTVSKEEYNKMALQNKRLIDQYVNGQKIEQPVPKEPVDIQALRNDLFGGGELSNLEYATKALQLREEIKQKEGKDIFLPYGNQISPTMEDSERADAVAKVFKECIEYAQGDSDIFTQELMRRTSEDSFRFRR